MNELQLDPHFAPWALTAGYSVSSTPSGLLVANAGGQIRYELVEDAGGILLTSAERAGNPTPEMWAANVRDSQTLLIRLVGTAMRSLRAAPRVFFPYGWDECAPGYAPRNLGDGWSGLTREHVPLALRFVDHAPLFPAVQFSYLIDADPRALMASYADPEGYPLLHKFLRPPEQ